MAKIFLKYPVILVSFLVMVISFTGCTSATYKPKISPVKPAMIPPVRFNQSIKIINAQSNEKYKITYGTKEIQETNLREVTEVAISILSDELRKRGATIDQDASKVLKLSVSNIQYLYTAWGSKCEVLLIVETGEGYYGDFARNNVGYSAGGVPRGTSCDFAITRTVAAIFEDGRIINYLNNP